MPEVISGTRQTRDLHKGWIRDARRRRVKQLDPVALQLLQRREPIERNALKCILGEKGIGLSKLERGSMIACLVLVAAFIITCYITPNMIVK